MKLVAAYLTWFIMAAILVAGIVLAAKGSLWLFVLGMLAFIAAFAKYGCLSH
jgi:hypothetical protein